MNKMFPDILGLMKFPISKYQISGNSMYPALKNGDLALVNRYSYLFTSPRIGDVVAVKDPRDGKILIKRVAKIENEKYFVTGDNKAESTDSRKFGMLDKRSIIGRVVFPKIQ